MPRTSEKPPAQSLTARPVSPHLQSHRTHGDRARIWLRSWLPRPTRAATPRARDRRRQTASERQNRLGRQVGVGTGADQGQKGRAAASDSPTRVSCTVPQRDRPCEAWPERCELCWCGGAVRLCWAELLAGLSGEVQCPGCPSNEPWIWQPGCFPGRLAFCGGRVWLRRRASGSAGRETRRVAAKLVGCGPELRSQSAGIS
jgi:hypothetical protein